MTYNNNNNDDDDDDECDNNDPFPDDGKTEMPRTWPVVSKRFNTACSVVSPTETVAANTHTRKHYCFVIFNCPCYFILKS